MTPQQHDLFGDDGRARRDDGIQQVLDHVGANWRSAYAAVVAHWFDCLVIGTEFSGEDLRRCALPTIGEPHHPNACGAQAAAFLRDWLSAGRIIQVGTSVSRSANNHAHVYRRYRKVAA